MRRTTLLPLPLLALPLSTLLATPACSKDEASEDDYAVGDELGDGDDEGDWGEGTSGADPGDGDGDEPEPEPDESETETETDTGEPVCDDQTEVVLYLSSDDSNSVSSPIQAREQVLSTGSLYYTSIRPWEFLNYYEFPYPAAEDHALALTAELREVADMPGRYQLQIAVASEAMDHEDRPPMNVTFVLDTSGSMAGHSLDMMKETCKAIAASLRAGDKVSMVEWDTSNTWTLAGYQVSGPNDAMLLAKIDELEADGGTDLNGGLSSGYELAQMTWDLDAVNRLVLVSDGVANAGVTEVELIAENAAYGGSDGIYLVGVGVGEAGYYNDNLMDEVTDAGKGASVFIPHADEAWKLFSDDFINTMAIAERNVQVELTMPPGFEIIEFSGEEFSGNPEEVEPQHIAPNDAMVFHQQIETCAPELIDEQSPIAVKVTWQDRETFEQRSLEQTYTFGELLEADATLLSKGAAVYAYAQALRELDGGSSEGIEPALAAVAAARELLPQDADLIEIEGVLQSLAD